MAQILQTMPCPGSAELTKSFASAGGLLRFSVTNTSFPVGIPVASTTPNIFASNFWLTMHANEEPVPAPEITACVTVSVFSD